MRLDMDWNIDKFFHEARFLASNYDIVIFN